MRRRRDLVAFKKIIGVIVILSFLYGNCVYALPDGGNRHTLQPSSKIPEISGLITRLNRDFEAFRNKTSRSV
jgi:hypothetical protein